MFAKYLAVPLRVHVVLLAVLSLVVAVNVHGQSAVDPFDDQFQAPPSKKKEGPVVPPHKNPDPPQPGLHPTTKEMLKYLDLKATVAPAKVKRGEIVLVTIEGTSKPYAYTYSAAKRHAKQSGSSTRLTYKATPWVKPLYPIQESASEAKKSSDGVAYILHDRFQWKQDIYIAPDAPLGVQKIPVVIRLQVCTKLDKVAGTAEFCIPAGDFVPLVVTIDVIDGPAAAPPTNLADRSTAPVLGDDGDAPNPRATKTDAPTSSLSGLLIAAFFGAILMLLTPCVFPMIPITVNFFIKQAEREHHRPFFMASVYAGTMVLLLTIVILAGGKTIIDLANDAWFNLGLGAILLLFALGLFGMFEVDLTKFFGCVLLILVGYGISRVAEKVIPGVENVNPAVIAILSILLAVPTTMGLARGLRAIETMLGFEESMVLNFLAKQESRGGMLGAAFMAMTFTITSFSCTGPFLGIMLAPLAEARPPLLHLVLAALVYSATFAAPFFMLALFPTYLKKLPKSGGWMTTIKVTMGFLEVGAALKFLAVTDIAWFPGNPQIFNYDTVLCSWIALSLACSAYLFGIYHLHHDTPEEHIGVPRMLFGSLFLGMTFYLIPLLFGLTPAGVVMEKAIAFLPPDFKGEDAIDWVKHDYAAAWKKAVDEKKPIFIDFTGVNCANCRENERNIFRRSDVAKELKKYVCVQLYTDIVPDPNLTSAQAKAQADVNIGYQLGLDKDLSQPTYIILTPDAEEPFEDGKIRGKLVDKRTGRIFDPADFLRFLQEPLKMKGTR